MGKLASLSPRDSPRGNSIYPLGSILVLYNRCGFDHRKKARDFYNPCEIQVSTIYYKAAYTLDLVILA